MISKCKLIDLPEFLDKRGKLSFIEGGRHIPFIIKRIYYLYQVPENVYRGSHAHNNLEQLIISISGEFDILLDDGFQKKEIHLDTPNIGLYIPPMIWRDLNNFSPGSVCMVLASEYFDKSDYVYDKNEFYKMVRQR